MTEIGERARDDLRKLAYHYVRLGRPEAIANLQSALDRALIRIDQLRGSGMPAPRPYPQMAREGERWVKLGRYWFGYLLSDPPVLVSVLFERADLPRRR